MKILIADDEELVRENLKDILLRISADFEIREAVNGRELIAVAEDFRPELCFSDIRMPGLSGLEAIEELRKEFPAILWIILSGYSDFDYARRALGLGVVDYLLKPATEDEVRATIEKSAVLMNEAICKSRETFESRLSSILNNTSSLEFDDYFSGADNWASLLFLIDSSGDEEQAAAAQKDFFSGLRILIDEEGRDYRLGIINIAERLPGLVASGPSPDVFLRDLSVSMKFPPELRIVAVLSPLETRLDSLVNHVENAEELDSMRFVLEPNGPYEAAELVRRWKAFTPDVRSFLSDMSIMIESKNGGAVSEVNKILHKLEQFGGEISGEDVLIRFLGTIFSIPESHSTVAGSLKYVRERIDFSLTGDSRDKAERLVDQAEVIVRSRFSETIGVAQVAEELNVTPNYLSTLFKKTKAISFTKYITGIRLEEARRLLCQPGITIKETSGLLGYQSSRHFARLFREKYGLSPSDYQSRN